MVNKYWAVVNLNDGHCSQCTRFVNRLNDINPQFEKTAHFAVTKLDSEVEKHVKEKHSSQL